VRLVGPIERSNHSRIQNRFWTTGEGFSPLLVGMGAAALAFVPVRNAVMSEGATEIILLPTLMREATERRPLGFQIAPASSEAPAARIGGLDAEAPGVVWLVDGDQGGRDLRKRLTRAGVPPERIVPIGNPRSEMVVEDLVRAAVYVEAFNEELRRSGHEKQLLLKVAQGVNRPRKAEAWCKRNRIKPPSKANVAYRMVEMRSEGVNLLSAQGKTLLKALQRKLDAIFEKKGPPPARVIV
jgi:predicted ATP-dependent endonuclease of OLD family